YGRTGPGQNPGSPCLPRLSCRHQSQPEVETPEKLTAGFTAHTKGPSAPPRSRRRPPRRFGVRSNPELFLLVSSACSIIVGCSAHRPYQAMRLSLALPCCRRSACKKAVRDPAKRRPLFFKEKQSCS